MHESNGKPLFILGIAVLLCAAIVGCRTAAPPVNMESSTSQARIVVTRGFGAEVIVDELVSLNGDTSAMDALKAVSNVETSYGGGFVDAISGIESAYSHGHTAKEDWFVFFNGIMSNTGALDYTLQSGDIEHWDYHDWDFRQFVPAIIGDFPAPFSNGYRGQVYPTVITYQDGWEEAAADIKELLAGQGISDIACRSLDELSPEEKSTANLILVGDSTFPLIEELNEPWNRLGFYAHFEEGQLEVFDQSGNPAAEYAKNTGLIQATQNIWNPKGTGACENVIWMVTGVDNAGVAAAVSALTESHDELRYACAAVVIAGETVRVP